MPLYTAFLLCRLLTLGQLTSSFQLVCEGHGMQLLQLCSRWLTGCWLPLHKPACKLRLVATDGQALQCTQLLELHLLKLLPALQLISIPACILVDSFFVLLLAATCNCIPCPCQQNSDPNTKEPCSIVASCATTKFFHVHPHSSPAIRQMSLLWRWLWLLWATNSLEPKHKVKDNNKSMCTRFAFVCAPTDAITPYHITR